MNSEEYELTGLSDKLVFVRSLLSLRTSAHTGVAIPRLEGKCSEKLLEEREHCDFRWGSLPGSIQPGDCHTSVRTGSQ